MDDYFQSQPGGRASRPAGRLHPPIMWRAALTLAALAVALALPACAPAAPPTPVTVQLNWTHGAQFAGMYAADQKGYYADEGLAVRFVEAGLTDDRIAPVLSGEAQFGIVGPPPLIQARAAGRPVRAVAAIYHHNPFVFFALADSGISRPQHFAGKTVQVIPSALPFLYAVTARVGLTKDQYRVDSTARLPALYDGTVDVASGFLTNEVLRARASGHELTIIYPDDYGVHFYGDVLYSSDEFITRNPEVVRRFLRATLRGWADVVEDPGSAAALVRQYAPGADPAWEHDIMAASVPLIFTGEAPLGWMEPDTWAQLATTLLNQEGLSAPLDPRDLYTMQFLEELYGADP